MATAPGVSLFLGLHLLLSLIAGVANQRRPEALLAIDKMYPSNRGSKKKSTPIFGTFGERKNFYDVITDYEAYLKSGRTIPPEIVAIIREKALISAHGQLSGRTKDIAYSMEILKY